MEFVEGLDLAARWVKPIRLDDDGRHMLPPLES